MRIVGRFKWNGRLPTDAEVGADLSTRYSADFGEQWAYQACQPVALAVFEGVRAIGVQLESEAPEFDEHHWFFGVILQGQNYCVRVQWDGMDDEGDGFEIEVTPRRSLIRSLFREPRCNFHAIRRALDGATRLVPDVQNLQWRED